MSYDILIKSKYTEEKLRELVAAFFNINVKLVGNIYDLETDGDVNIDVHYKDGDFATLLSVYKKKDFRPELHEINFALYLSKEFFEDVLTPYWDDNPFAWILTNRNGDIFKVYEILCEQQDTIKINRSIKEKLDLNIVYSHMDF